MLAIKETDLFVVQKFSEGYQQTFVKNFSAEYILYFRFVPVSTYLCCMIVFPNAKINLGLHVTEKRADGYHTIETVFFPVSLADALECVVAKGDNPSFEFKATGMPPGDTAENICQKAWRLLAQDYPLPPLQVHLLKKIPTGAGLGGGSSDGAFMLRLINNLCRLSLTDEQLCAYATQLGSDCAFFIHNTPCLATGRGEILEPITLVLRGYYLVLVNPGIHVSTAEAYKGIRPKAPDFDLRLLTFEPVESWKKFLVNDFEPTVFARYPAIAEVKETLYRQGALYAAMSGSGSTVFGLFETKPGLGELFRGLFCREELIGGINDYIV